MPAATASFINLRVASVAELALCLPSPLLTVATPTILASGSTQAVALTPWERPRPWGCHVEQAQANWRITWRGYASSSARVYHARGARGGCHHHARTAGLGRIDEQDAGRRDRELPALASFGFAVG